MAKPQRLFFRQPAEHFIVFENSDGRLLTSFRDPWFGLFVVFAFSLFSAHDGNARKSQADIRQLERRHDFVDESDFAYPVNLFKVFQFRFHRHRGIL